MGLFHKLSFKYYDLTNGQVDYPQLLKNTYNKGPEIPVLEICVCGAWINKTQVESNGKCNRCIEQSQQYNKKSATQSKVIAIKGRR